MVDDDRASVRVRGGDAVSRLRDHRAISRLADELLPSLIAKLGATGLGEIEVREGAWRVRVRRPGEEARTERRPGERPSRSQPGHEGHGHAPAAVEGHRSGAARPSSGTPVPVGPGPAAEGGLGRAAAGAGSADGFEESGGTPVRRPGAHRAVATSPAVGVFQPRPEISSGTRVRAGDRLAIVDMLGIPQDVVSPVDGIVGASLVEPGEAVEYGQELIRIELAAAPAREREAQAAGTGAGAGGSAGRPAGGVSGVPGVDPIDGGRSDEPDAFAPSAEAEAEAVAPGADRADVAFAPTGTEAEVVAPGADRAEVGPQATPEAVTAGQP